MTSPRARGTLVVEMRRPLQTTEGYRTSSWLTAVTDFSGPGHVRVERRRPAVDHDGRITSRRFGRPHEIAVAATAAAKRRDRRAYGSAARTVRLAAYVLKYSTNPVARARATSALRAALYEASPEHRRFLASLAMGAMQSPTTCPVPVETAGTPATGPPGQLVAASPLVPRGPTSVIVAPQERCAVSVFVG